MLDELLPEPVEPVVNLRQGGRGHQGCGRGCAMGPGSAQEGEDLLAVGDGLGVAVDALGFGNLECHEVGVHARVGERFQGRRWHLHESVLEAKVQVDVADDVIPG